MNASDSRLTACFGRSGMLSHAAPGKRMRCLQHISRDSVFHSSLAGGLVVHQDRGRHTLIQSRDVDVLDLCCGKGSPQRRLIPDRLRCQPPLSRHVWLAELQRRCVSHYSCSMSVSRSCLSCARPSDSRYLQAYSSVSPRCASKPSLIWCFTSSASFGMCRSASDIIRQDCGGCRRTVMRRPSSCTHAYARQ